MSPGRTPEGQVLSVNLSVESRPSGAMISVDGVHVGTSPAIVRLELDRAGRLLSALEVSADYSIVAPVRGVAHVVVARYRRGDALPRQLMLARPADGGIQGLGNFVPGM